MSKVTKTVGKRSDLLVPGAGPKFSKENQPSPEAKKKGWQQLRAERHLSQAIIKEMLGDDGKPTDTFKDYIRSLVINAKDGNAKAIEAVNKFIEDDVQKIALTDPDGQALKQTITLSNGNEINLA